MKQYVSVENIDGEYHRARRSNNPGAFPIDKDLYLVYVDIRSMITDAEIYHKRLKKSLKDKPMNLSKYRVKEEGGAVTITTND